VERQPAEMDARRQRLAALADAALGDALAGGGGELHGSAAAAVHAAAGVLAAAAGGAHAARRLLDAHSGRIRRLQQQLLKPQNAGARPVIPHCRPAALSAVILCMCSRAVHARSS